MSRGSDPAAPGRPAIAAVIFDCDGTLVDSESAGLDVLYEQARELGLTLSRERVHEAFRGRRMADSIATIGASLPQRPADFDHAAFERQVRAAMAQRFRQDLHAMPGAVALLEALRVPFCVATNGPREKAELTLGLTGLLRHFEARIFSAYDVAIVEARPRVVPACSACARCRCGALRGGRGQPARRRGRAGGRDAGLLDVPARRAAGAAGGPRDGNLRPGGLRPAAAPLSLTGAA